MKVKRVCLCFTARPRKLSKAHPAGFKLEAPRDRASSFEPQMVKKYLATVSNEIKIKMHSMYGLGMSSSHRGTSYRSPT